MVKERKKNYLKKIVNEESPGINFYIEKYEQTLKNLVSLVDKTINDLEKTNLSIRDKIKLLEIVLPYLKQLKPESSFTNIALFLKQTSNKEDREKEVILALKKSLE